MKKIHLYILVLIVAAFLYGGMDVKADSWGEPVRTETVRRTKSTTKFRTKYKAAETKVSIGKSKTTVTTSTRVSSGKKVVTTQKTVSQNITKNTKGSKIICVTKISTITTTTDTYRYYYDLNTGTKQNGRQNVEFSLDKLKKYLPGDIVALLKAQGVHIYLYSDHPVLKKAGIVGVAVWSKTEKAAYVKYNHWYVILHETAHLLDTYAIKNKVAAQSYSSASKYFQKVFRKDRTKVQGSYSISIREYFAESVMYYYLRPTKLKEERPDTYEAIRKFIATLQKS